MNDENPFESLILPSDLALPDGSLGTITAIRPSNQLPEAIEGDAATGWIPVPSGHVLAEVVYDTPAQPACTIRLALDPSGDIAAQIAAYISR